MINPTQRYLRFDVRYSLGIYFYLPPAGAGLEALVSEEIFLGVLTAYGLARLIGSG